MTWKQALLSGMLLMAVLVATCEAATRYVSLGGGNVWPFTTWATAATNISQAYLWDNVLSGDVIVVSNGIYNVTYPRRIMVSVTITGAYGAAQTILDGTGYNDGGLGYPPFWNDYTITVSLCDLTYRNFPRSAIRAAGIAYYIKNCVLVNNTSDFGAGIYGGPFYATNCVIRGNVSTYAGGGVYYTGVTTGVMDNCVIESNRTVNNFTDGGGVFAGGRGFIMRNCRISGNTCGEFGGGVYLGVSNTMQNCLVTGNSSAQRDADGGGVGLYGVMQNCTVVSNIAGRRGGGVFGTGTSINSIVYFNWATNTSYITTSNYVPGPFWVNSCTAPNPGPSLSTNCVTADPKMVDIPADCHLLRGSPCINRGLNQYWMTNAADLDGFPRIRESIVDMGAYERLPKCTVFRSR